MSVARAVGRGSAAVSGFAGAALVINEDYALFAVKQQALPRVVVLDPNRLLPMLNLIDDVSRGRDRT